MRLDSCNSDIVIQLKGTQDYWLLVGITDVAVGDWREPRYVLFNLTTMQTEQFNPAETEVEPQISSNSIIPWLPLLLHLLQKVNKQEKQIRQLYNSDEG